jgi:hypothetical protein
MFSIMFYFRKTAPNTCNLLACSSQKVDVNRNPIILVHICNSVYTLNLKVNESFPFSIALSWKGAALDTQNGAADNQQSTTVFPKGNPIPSVKALTFYRSGTFSVDVQYADVSELQAPARISTYTVIYLGNNSYSKNYTF